MKAINERPAGTIKLPAGTTFIPFEQVEYLLADAMAPDAPPIERFTLRTLIGRELVDAARDGALRISHPKTGGPLGRDVRWGDVETSVVSVPDFSTYAAARNINVTVRAPPNPITRGQQMRLQEDAILSIIRQMGYVPSELPKQKLGVSGIKKRVKEALGNEELWQARTAFEHAWERLRDEGAIREHP